MASADHSANYSISCVTFFVPTRYTLGRRRGQETEDIAFPSQSPTRLVTATAAMAMENGMDDGKTPSQP